mgnify:CR=1 FL=1
MNLVAVVTAVTVDLPAVKPNCLSDSACLSFNEYNVLSANNRSSILPRSGSREMGLHALIVSQLVLLFFGTARTVEDLKHLGKQE